nr:antiviral reverse transcriptase Drt3a [Caballeronia sp. dw_19]
MQDSVRRNACAVNKQRKKWPYQTLYTRASLTGGDVIELAYTEKRLARCITYSDLINDKRLLDRKNRLAAANRTLQGINAGTLFHADLDQITIRGKSAYKCRNIEQMLATRLVSQNIRANYRIRQQNRNVIIKNLISMLKESGPYNIFRFDIESFFENIDRKELKKRLMNDGQCSRQTILLIFQLFDRLDKQSIVGLPRGLGISATLSEYVLHEFDNAIKRENDVFFYARFVDDIVLITSPDLNKSAAINLLDKNIFPGLNIHKKGKKISQHFVPRATDNNQENLKIHPFEYLGYQFSIFENNHLHDTILGIPKRRIEVDICQEKIDKLTGRVINSFTSYISTSTHSAAFALLENRIKALTGNYIINDPSTNISIKTGIYYNYHEKNITRDCPLKKLDALLRGLLFSKNHALSMKIQSKIDFTKRRKLVGYTFSSGFYKRRLHYFTNKDLKTLKEAWKK